LIWAAARVPSSVCVGGSRIEHDDVGFVLGDQAS